MFDYPTLYPEFITTEEQIWMKVYALDLLVNGKLNDNPAGPNRNYLNIAGSSFYTEEIHSVYKRIVSHLKLENPMIDPLLGIIISVISPGGFVHEHTDNYERKYPELAFKKNVRFNIMVDRGEDISYNPQILNQPFIVNLRDAWCFPASHLPHKTSAINGPQKRIVYQFGFCI